MVEPLRKFVSVCSAIDLRQSLSLIPTIHFGSLVSSQSNFQNNESGSTGLSTANSVRETKPIVVNSTNSHSRSASRTAIHEQPSPRLFSAPMSSWPKCSTNSRTNGSWCGQVMNGITCGCLRPLTIVGRGSNKQQL